MSQEEQNKEPQESQYTPIYVDRSSKKPASKSIKIWYGALVIACLVLLGIVIDSAQSGYSPADIPPSTPTEPQITQTVMTELYSLSDDEVVSKYINVREVKDKGDYLYIGIDINYNPELIVVLEDAFSLAESFTNAIAREAVKTINVYGIDKDISVWARLPLEEDEIVLLGNTWYWQHSQSFVFERYKP